MLEKAKSLVYGQAPKLQGRAAKQATKPRFESVLKDRPRRTGGLKRHRPGISQTQEDFARQWRQNNTLYLVKK